MDRNRGRPLLVGSKKEFTMDNGITRRRTPPGSSFVKRGNDTTRRHTPPRRVEKLRTAHKEGAPSSLCQKRNVRDNEEGRFLLIAEYAREGVTVSLACYVSVGFML